MRKTSMLLAGVAAFGSAQAGDRDPADVWGLWYTPDRDSLVEIRDCGDGTPCGTVRWVDPVRAQVTHDTRNPDEALRGRPMEGIVLLSGFEAAERGWQGGDIYHPGQGRTYRARVRRTGEDALKVSGCVGPICKGMTWHRAEDRLAASQRAAPE